ncbi:hypothetical protein ACHAWF_000147, partial [Thalassiosira exigua]
MTMAMTMRSPPTRGDGGSGGAPSTPGASSSSSASANAASSNPDSYLADDFLPLSLASDEILAALRADESDPDADLYRRLVSGGGGEGGGRYRAVRDGASEGIDARSGDGGVGVGAGVGGSTPSADGRRPSPPPRGNAIGSPPGAALRGAASSR